MSKTHHKTITFYCYFLACLLWAIASTSYGAAPDSRANQTKAGVRLEKIQAEYTADGHYVFSHKVTNTGSVGAHYSISAEYPDAGIIKTLSFHEYRANSSRVDGIPKLPYRFYLASGESFRFLVGGLVSMERLNHEGAEFKVRAQIEEPYCHNWPQPNYCSGVNTNRVLPQAPKLTLEPKGKGQVAAGSSITFAHHLANSGNVDIERLSLSLNDSLRQEGWQSLIYEDLNGDGLLSDNDPIINADMTLAKNEIKHLIVKVFAPANAAQGISNITTLTARWADGNHPISIEDVSTANNAQLAITKEQALWNCVDPLPEDQAFSQAILPASPGSCVVYKLTATNQGVATANHVMIQDSAPEFTDFINRGGLPKADQALSVSSGESEDRKISATWEALGPGESVSLYFAIKIQ